MNIIHVANLTKMFGSFTAVNDITFDVENGEIFAFLGPNGAGKSTTIKILTTLLTATKGDVTVNGFRVDIDKYRVRSSFGIVFQDPSLDDELTALENMEFHGVLYNIPADVRKKRIKELLSIVELWEKKDHLIKTFSGGMKRRLEIARGLLHHPKILFLDEPTLGLDPQTRNLLWQYVKELNSKEGITVFFTTHYMEEAERVAGRIAVIDHGKIVASGTAEALKEQTKTQNLEDAFLSFTGREIREEDASTIDKLRTHRQLWRR